MHISRDSTLPFIKNICLIILGTITLAFGTAVFIIPFDLVTGGMAGLAISINRIIPSFSIDLIITVLIWSLFAVGFFALGKSFALKTLISAIIYPPSIAVFSKLLNPELLGNILNLKTAEYSDIAVIIATVFGGVSVGAGCAITFLGGGSTGGTDIIAFTICKIFKRLKSSAVIFVVDASIIVLGFFAIRDLSITLLGIIAAFTAALVIDKIFVGGSKALIAQIISDNYEKINQAVIKQLKRTTTIVDITGGYTGKAKKMIVVSFTMRQYAELNNIINQNDRSAFVTVHIAHEINGEGWTR